MKIIGVDDLTVAQVRLEVANGAKFVTFQYCISIVIMTFRRGSDIYFIRAGENALVPAFGFTLLSLLLGWWGIPWGPIYTVGAIFTNLGGGKDVTRDVLALLGPVTASSQPEPAPVVKLSHESGNTPVPDPANAAQNIADAKPTKGGNFFDGYPHN